jgi:stalled ribosome rescue protein Dom34
MPPASGSVEPNRKEQQVSHYHAVVWLDHSEAHVLQFTPQEVEAAHIQSKQPHKHLHAKHTVHEKHRAEGGYYYDVVQALRGAKEILVCGPGAAKLELINYMHEHAHDLVPTVVGVETVDHPSDGQLLKYARSYFKVADRMIQGGNPIKG